jgi:hypothetical protein
VHLLRAELVDQNAAALLQELPLGALRAVGALEAAERAAK